MNSNPRRGAFGFYPDYMIYKGVKVRVNTGFARWVSAVCEMERGHDPVLCANIVSGFISPGLIDGNITEEDAFEYLEAAARFACGGRSREDVSAEVEKLFDFAEDMEKIDASFLVAYGIDLASVNMHWYRFTGLLMNLPENTPFVRAVAVRGCDTTKIRDDELRRIMRRRKAKMRLKGCVHG